MSRSADLGIFSIQLILAQTRPVQSPGQTPALSRDMTRWAATPKTIQTPRVPALQPNSWCPADHLQQTQLTCVEVVLGSVSIDLFLSFILVSVLAAQWYNPFTIPHFAFEGQNNRIVSTPSAYNLCNLAPLNNWCCCACPYMPHRSSPLHPGLPPYLSQVAAAWGHVIYQPYQSLEIPPIAPQKRLLFLKRWLLCSFTETANHFQ